MPRITLNSPPFSPDSRANRIDKKMCAAIPDDPSPQQWLYVCGPVEAMTQLDLIAGARASSATVPKDLRGEYNHARLFLQGVPADVWAAAEVLETILTMTAKPHLDFAVALDWYKVPDPALEPKSWPNTPAGESVSKGKYWSGLAGKRARQDLLGRVVEMIHAHPLLAGVDAIVSVPGHNADGRSFGERFARAVADEVGKPLVETACPGGPRGAQKEETSQDLEGQFAMPATVRGSVIVLDDVYKTGGTMNAVALAARHGGAAHVFGVAAVRTMRRG